MSRLRRRFFYQSINLTIMRKLLFLSILSIFTTVAFCQGEPTLEQKLSQMLVIGFKGTELKADNPIVSFVKTNGVGGIILFEHNIKPVQAGVDSKAALAKLCADLKALSPDPIMLAVDQEGGRVNRLKSKYGFPAMPSAAAVAEAGLDGAATTFAIIADAVKSAGFNTNFAPCVDLNINPACPIIGKVERSYGDDPDIVAYYGSLFVGEHRKRGLATSLKHFPGHGSSQSDSHNGFTDVTDSWQEKEMRPYEIMFAKGDCDMVMITHVFNGNIDPKYPASLSSLTINTLLREKMGWDGIVITDDMQMGAITKNYGFKEALVLSVNAGVDMLIISSNTSDSQGFVFDRALKALVEAVKSGEISQQRVDEAYERIIEFKNERF